MNPSRKFLVALSIFALNTFAVEMPVSFDERLKIELVAQEPEIVTPTGAAVDESGRIWVIENNTHERSKTYKGHASDRIQIFEDFAPDGRAQKVTTFADGFRHSMNLIFSKDGDVMLAMRSEILLLSRIEKIDGKPVSKSLIKLDTKGNYPHNGLSGLALGADGKLYFGLGENLGEAYTVRGSDGTELKGGGEGGNVYRCEPDGSKPERIATGFWNPWALGFDATGRLFAVDNDPDSRPPCRLIHVVNNGDYGYKFRYGRKGTHPFVSWNGEIPGTLPMVAGTGEAPCAVYACESPVFPRDLRGDLLVTCWGDHVVQRFKLEPAGASFHAMPEVIIKGSANFRPVALVPAPDGSLVMTDWVSESYPVHGKGRIWRIRGASDVKPEAKSPVMLRVTDVTPEQGDALLLEMMAKSLNTGANLQDECERIVRSNSKALEKNLASTDPFLFRGAINALERFGSSDGLAKFARSTDPRVRLATLLALRNRHIADTNLLISSFLADSDAAVRRAAMQWVGEERLTEFAARLDATTKMPMTRDLFEAYLAAKSLLSGDKPDKGEYVESQMTQIFPSDKHSPHFRALALRNLRVDHPGVTVAELKELLLSEDTQLSGEAVRALALHPHPDVQPELRKLAADTALSLGLRADAIAGLARSAAKDPESKTLLLSICSEQTESELQREAMRALRGAADFGEIATMAKALTRKRDIPDVVEQLHLLFKIAGGEPPDLPARKRPTTEVEWTALLNKPNAADNVAAGARLFYHERGPRCFVCHRINGRGGNIGPDLSAIGKTVVRERLLQSILDPAREVAPQFVPWTFVLRDGRRVTGMIVEENQNTVQVGDNDGKITRIKETDIDRRAAQKGSVMPEKLVDLMTVQEVRDLIAFLSSCGAEAPAK